MDSAHFAQGVADAVGVGASSVDATNVVPVGAGARRVGSATGVISASAAIAFLALVCWAGVAQAAEISTDGNARANTSSNTGANTGNNITGNTAAKTNRLGRLFFTAEQRAILDQQRRSGFISADPSASRGYSIDGLIHQRKGAGTTWINGYEIPLKSPTDSVHLPGLANQPLKVGEVVDPKTGEAWDILPAGQSIRPGK